MTITEVRLDESGGRAFRVRFSEPVELLDETQLSNFQVPDQDNPGEWQGCFSASWSGLGDYIDFFFPGEIDSGTPWRLIGPLPGMSPQPIFPESGTTLPEL